MGKALLVLGLFLLIGNALLALPLPPAVRGSLYSETLHRVARVMVLVGGACVLVGLMAIAF